MRPALQFAAAFLSLWFAAAPASAAVMQATFSGQTSGFVDDFGLFGPTGSSVGAGVASMTFQYDTLLGTPWPTGGFKDERIGGNQFGTSSPVTSFSFTTGGATVSAPTTNSLVGLFDQPGFGQGFKVESWLGLNPSSLPAGTVFIKDIVAAFWSSSLSLPATLDVPFSVSNIRGFIGQPQSGQFVSIIVSRCDLSNFFRCSDTNFQMSIDSFSLTAVPAAVPLPSAGGLLIGALGAVGMLGRRRRLTAVA